jgi:uncharacterized repeat protein (TIGR03943 family)
MTKLFNRWLPSVTLLVWSGVLLAFYFSGKVASILIPGFRLNVLLAGLAMLAMACCFLFLPAVANCCNDESCGHPLGKRKLGRLITFLVLILPVTAAAMFSPGEYGKQAILNKGISTDMTGLVRNNTPKWMAQTAAQQGQQSQQTASANSLAEPPLPTKSGTPDQTTAATQSTDNTDQFLPRNKDGNIEVQVIDLLYAAEDSSMRADFTGKTVETIGQLMPDDTHNVTGNRFKLMRMFMYCCAADAKPIATIVNSPQAPAAQEMEWVKVVGKVTFPVEGGRTIPVLEAVTVEKTDPPAETMLY